jgi:hypothetical protein
VELEVPSALRPIAVIRDRDAFAQEETIRFQGSRLPSSMFVIGWEADEKRCLTLFSEMFPSTSLRPSPTVP